MNGYNKFLSICIANRNSLEISEKEMASYLEGVSENEYISFEKGEYKMNESNLNRIARVLCVKNTELFNLSDYIDTEGLSEEEIDDLSLIVSEIVGGDNA